MKVSYKRVANLVNIATTLCCPHLGRATGADLIGFGDVNKNDREGDYVAIYQYDPHAYDDQYVVFPINFCPFCGAAIEIALDPDIP